jgi:hypothetical protein
MPPLFTLDFEASCLPQHGRSFPIEVGISGGDGVTRSWLIKPHDAWRDWTWSEEAERLHGVSFEQLMDEGVPAQDVLFELTAALGGRPAVADSYLDESWMRTLERAVGAPPLVRVQHIHGLIDQWSVANDAVLSALSETNALPWRRHRAAEDALRLQALVARLWLVRGSEQTVAPAAWSDAA